MACLRPAARVVPFLVLLLLPVRPAHAQSNTSGRIVVYVTGAADEPVRDARVVLDGASGAARVLTERTAGTYEAGFLRPAEHTVLVERLGSRPVRVTAIPVRPGATTRVDVVLEAASPPVDSIEVRAYRGWMAATARWVDSDELHNLPFRARALADVGSLASAFAPDLAAQGLPARYTASALDGFELPAAHHPVFELESDAGRPDVPLIGLGAVELLTDPVDVEWSAVPGGLLSAFARRAGATSRGGAFGEASSGGMFDGSGLGGLASSWLQGGAHLDVPFAGDSAALALSLEARSLDRPFARVATAPEFDAVAAAANDAFGREMLGSAERAVLLPGSSVSGLADLDWIVHADHELSVRAVASSTSRTVLAAGDGEAFADVEGTTLHAGALLTSRFERGLSNELAIGFGRIERTFAAAELAAAGDGLVEADELSPGRLALVAAGIGVGTDPELPADQSRSMLRLREAVTVTLGPHRVKLGIDAGLDSWSLDYASLEGPVAVFADSARIAERLGLLRRIADPSTGASFDMRRLGGFLQDRWAAAPDVDVTVGVRVASNTLPADDIVLDPEWVRLTGIDNTAAPEQFTDIEPRGSLLWRVTADWSVFAAGGIWAGQPDASALAGAIVDDGGARVTRYAGPLTPSLQPAEVTATRVARTLTLLDPEFRSPRTARGTFGVAGAVGPLELSARVDRRETTHLPRRHDLNLQLVPAFTDQHGRVLYGEPLKQGGLIAAEPSTNRRFPEYDQVWVIAADGTSRYTGVTVGLAGDAGPLRFTGEYTRATTEDDMRDAARRHIAPVPPSLQQGVADADALATSDFDAPHRFALSGQADFDIGALRLGAAGVFRYRSGLPFTPGFRDYVDPNTDDMANDVAFIDRDVPGMDALLGEWDCLRSAAGRFAERNICRRDAVRSLDLRFSLAGSFGGARLEAYLDALDLLRDDNGIVDRAVYLVDPDAPLVTSERRVTIPLVANPDFGELLIRTSTGRRLRLGVEIAFGN